MISLGWWEPLMPTIPNFGVTALPVRNKKTGPIW